MITLRLLNSSCLLLATLSSARGVDKPDDARKLLLPVVEALEAIEHPQSGRGSAALKVHDTGGYHEHHVEFMFKDELSRTDQFQLTDGKRGERQVAWAMGREVYVGCNEFNAVVQRQPSTQWHREFRYDFHPDTFTSINHRSVASLLQRLIDGPSSISVDMDDNGLFKIETEYRNDERDSHRLFCLDKTIGFRPVLYERTRTYLKGEEGTTKSCLRMSWKQYGGTWYVSKAEYEQAPAFFTIVGEKPPVKRPYRNHIEFVVEDFVPDVDISDSEFTLAGLRLPDGMPVVDSVGGVTYRYGTAPPTMAELEEVLSKAEFPKSMEVTLDANDTTEGSAAVDTRQGREPTIQEGSIRPSRSRIYGIVLAVTTVLAGVTLVLLARRRLSLTRGGK